MCVVCLSFDTIAQQINIFIAIHLNTATAATWKSTAKWMLSSTLYARIWNRQQQQTTKIPCNSIRTDLAKIFQCHGLFETRKKSLSFNRVEIARVWHSFVVLWGDKILPGGRQWNLKSPKNRNWTSHTSIRLPQSSVRSMHMLMRTWKPWSDMTAKAHTCQVVRSSHIIVVWGNI